MDKIEIDKSLEEAAEEFAEQEWDGLHDTNGNALYTEDYIKYTFIAGAEWQKSRDALTAAEVGCIVSLDAQLREDYPDREQRHQRIAEIINQDRKTEQK